MLLLSGGEVGTVSRGQHAYVSPASLVIKNCWVIWLLRLADDAQPAGFEQRGMFRLTNIRAPGSRPPTPPFRNNGGVSAVPLLFSLVALEPSWAKPSHQVRRLHVIHPCFDAPLSLQ